MISTMNEPAEPATEQASEDAGEYDKYDLESWARTLMEAKEIEQDPKKMAALKPHLEKKHAAITSIAGLRDVAKRKKVKTLG